MKRNYLYILFYFFLPIKLIAQSDNNFLSEEEFLLIVKKFHPVVLQANNMVEQAKTDVLEARGAFDPILNTNTSKKELGSKVYYNYNQLEIKIPTWYGIEVNAGIENVSGNNTDPQKTFNSSSYAGVSFSVIKNIVIDKRRASLQQAKIMTELSEAEKNVAVNNLLYDALSTYWQWVQTYNEYKIVSDVISVNKNRIDFTKKVIEIGERPSIDSFEAITQLQYYENLQSDLYMQMQNQLIQLSNFTWKENAVPYNLPENLMPSSGKFSPKIINTDLPSQDNLIQQAIISHPELEIYKSKFQYLEIDKKLKFQELLPDVKVKYNQLGKNYNMSETIVQPLLQNNYNYALSFAMPLRLSQARANYTQAKLKITNTQFQKDLKQRVIENKIKEQFNTLTQLKNQINIQQKLYENLNILLDGEKTRFENGESSLFLINSREQKSIETLQKLNTTIAKFYKQKIALRFASGLLWKE